MRERGSMEKVKKNCVDVVYTLCCEVFDCPQNKTGVIDYLHAITPINYGRKAVDNERAGRGKKYFFDGFHGKCCLCCSTQFQQFLRDGRREFYEWDRFEMDLQPAYSKKKSMSCACSKPMELQTARVYVPPHLQGLFIPSELFIRAREIVLRDEQVFFWCANAPHRSQHGLSDGQRLLVVVYSG